MNNQHNEKKPVFGKAVPLAVAGILLIAGMSMFAYVYPALENQQADQSDTQTTESNPDDIVAQFRQRDQALLNKWKDKKNERATDQLSSHAQQHYDHQVRGLEDALEQQKDSVDRPRSIASGLRDDIKKMRDDAPGLN